MRVDIKEIPYALTLSYLQLETVKILDNYDVIVLTETSYLQQRAFGEYCRARGKKIIIGDAYGAFGRVLTDFGKGFTVYDKDGEEPVMDFVGGIEEDGRVGLIDGKKHMFEDGDCVVFDGVEGMETVGGGEGVIQESKGEEGGEFESVNKQVFKITCTDKKSFNIGPLQGKFAPYVRNGIVKSVKIPIDVEFRPLTEIFDSGENAVDENL